MKTGRHIALFGGTFNPIHYGHLRAGQSVIDLCKLDAVYFIPSYLPPHRELELGTEAAHRYKMVHLACKDHRQFFARDFEAKNRQVSYTIHTVKHFIWSEPPGTKIRFLMGTDAFAILDTWFRIRELLGLCDFLVMVRPGTEDTLTDVLPEKLRSEFKEISDQRLVHKSGKQTNLISIDGLELSSTEVRRCVGKEEDTLSLVPATVAEYINQNGLYRKTEPVQQP